MIIDSLKPKTFRTFIARYGLYLSYPVYFSLLFLCFPGFLLGVFFGWPGYAVWLLLFPATYVIHTYVRYMAWPDAAIDTSREVRLDSGFALRHLQLTQESITAFSDGKHLWTVPWANISGFRFADARQMQPISIFIFDLKGASEMERKQGCNYGTFSALGYRPDPIYVAEVIRAYWQANALNNPGTLQ